MQPLSIKLHKRSAIIELAWPDGLQSRLGAEFLRVYSPSAEVRGHGPGQEVLQTGKRRVSITRVEPVGNYAVRLHFDDGHDTGIYSWEYLFELSLDHDQLWQQYLDRLEAAGASRDPVDPHVQVVNIMPLKKP